MDTPQTLLDAIKHFADPKNCRDFMIAVRWDDGIVRCPYCGSDKVKFMEKSNLYFCPTKHPKQKFSLKVGTIFEDSPIGLDKWLPAAWLLVNCKNGISSYEVARALGLTQKAAWHVLHRIRYAMTDTGLKLGINAPVEIDETFVGGKAKNIHKSKRRKEGYQNGGGKAIVLGMLERGGKVRAGVVDGRKKEHLQAPINANVEVGANIMTDELTTYQFVAHETYVHDIINHVEGYVRGHFHTMGSRISGRSWSVDSRESTSAWSRSTLTPTSPNKYSDSTTAIPQMMRAGSFKSCPRSLGSASLMPMPISRRVKGQTKKRQGRGKRVSSRVLP